MLSFAYGLHKKIETTLNHLMCLFRNIVKNRIRNKLYFFPILNNPYYELINELCLT